MTNSANATRHAMPGTIQPIKRGDSTGSLIILPNLSGSVIYAKAIVSKLHGATNVSGLIVDISVLEELHSMSISDLARRFALDLKMSNLPRPFHLMGHSFAGLLSFETAVQLRKQGEDVGLVAVLNTELPSRYFPNPIMRYRRYIGDHLLFRRAQIKRMIAQTPAVGADQEGSIILHAPGFVSLDLTKQPNANRSIIRHLYRAMLEYKPSTLDRQVTLIRTRKQAWFAQAPKDYGWGRFSEGQPEVIEIDAGHLDFIRDERTSADVARILQSCFDSRR